MKVQITCSTWESWTSGWRRHGWSPPSVVPAETERAREHGSRSVLRQRNDLSSPYGIRKIWCVPTRRQTMCGSPGVTSAPY